MVLVSDRPPGVSVCLFVCLFVRELKADFLTLFFFFLGTANQGMGGSVTAGCFVYTFLPDP